MDLGVQYTDRELLILERKIKKIYEEAEKDIEAKIADFNRRRGIKDSIHLKELRNGTITQEEYNRWVAGQNFQGKQWTLKREQIANVLYNANSEALKIINGGTISIFNENANYAAYLLEKKAGVNFGFGLYDANAVTNLIKNDPNILPFNKLDKTKDVRWNFKKIRGQITQGIIQGESLEKIAKRIATVTGSQNRRQMMTHARTAMTSAQNAGRQIRYTEAAEKGIELHKEWMATFDTHTRDAHRQLDGQKVPVDKPFKVDGYEINFPGDPHAQPYLVYNCRCTMVADLDDFPEMYQRYDNINGRPVSQMTYKEWYDAKEYTEGKTIKKQTTEKAVEHKVVQGKDLTGEWERREDEFAFEIEDVINAQGFDGKPRVVSMEEFDRAVKEANDGNGFIAQRTYSAPDQETLDAYRQQLYEGKWYVDCSNGGCAYGKGMYSAYANNTEVTEYIEREMRGYSARRGIDYNYIETFTLTPDARTITPNEIIELRQSANKKLMAEFKERGGWKSSDAMEWAETHDISGLDDGSFAALMGYDAILTHGIDDYAIILNRTKVIFKEP